MNRRAAESFAEYQTTWIWLGSWVIFDDFAVKHREIDFIERETIHLGFFVSVIGNPNAVCLDCLNDYGDIHILFFFRRRRSQLLSNHHNEIARFQHDDFFTGGKIARVESWQVRATFAQRRRENRRIFGICLTFTAGNVGGFWVWHNAEATVDDLMKGGEFGRQLGGEIALDFDNRLLRGDTIKQRDFAHLQHDVTRAVFGRSSRSSKDHIGIYKHLEFLTCASGSTFLGCSVHVAPAIL